MAEQNKNYTRVLVERDYTDWYRLFLGYREFYNVPFNKEEIDQTWQWLMDGEENIDGLVCIEKLDNGYEKVIGFMHYFEEISSIGGKKGGFLNDLYVDPESRGKGVFESLFSALKEVGKEQGWTRIQWRTAEDNYRARSAYDRISTKTVFLTYRMDIR